MADSFTANQVQGVFGEWKPILDEVDVDFSDDNVQGISGEWKPVLDEAAAAVVAGRIMSSLVGAGGLANRGGIAGQGGGLAG